MLTIDDAIRIVQEGSDKQVIDAVFEISNDFDLLKNLLLQAKAFHKARLKNAQVMPDNAKELKELIAKHSDRLLWLKHSHDPNGNKQSTKRGMWSAATSKFELTKGLVSSAEYMNVGVLPESAKKVKVNGDTHADFGSFLTLFIRKIRKARKQRDIWIDLGDVIDRGKYPTETTVFCLLQMLSDPEHFLYQQGNHEGACYMSAHWEKENCFGEQLRKKFSESKARTLFNGFGELYSLLPMFIFSNDLQFIASHAGLPRLEEKFISPSLEQVLEEGVTPLPAAKKFLSLKKKEGWSDYWLETWGEPVCVAMDGEGQFVRTAAGKIKHYPIIDDERNAVPENIKIVLTFTNAARVGPDVNPDDFGDDMPLCFSQFYYNEYKKAVEVKNVLHVRGHSLPLSLVPNDILPYVFLFQSTGRGGLGADEDFKKKIIPTWGEIDLTTLSVETKQLYAGCDDETLSEIVLAFVYFYLKDKGKVAEQKDVSKDISYDAQEQTVTFRVDQDSFFELADLKSQLTDMLEFYKYVVSFRYGETKSVDVPQKEKIKKVSYVPVSIMIPKNGASRLKKCQDLAGQFVADNPSFFVEGMQNNYSVDSKQTYDQITFFVAVTVRDLNAIQIYEENEMSYSMKSQLPLDFFEKLCDFTNSFLESDCLSLQVSLNDLDDDNDPLFNFDEFEDDAAPSSSQPSNECFFKVSGVPFEAWERFFNGDKKVLKEGALPAQQKFH